MPRATDHRLTVTAHDGAVVLRCATCAFAQMTLDDVSVADVIVAEHRHNAEVEQARLGHEPLRPELARHIAPPTPLETARRTLADIEARAAAGVKAVPAREKNRRADLAAGYARAAADAARAVARLELEADDGVIVLPADGTEALCVAGDGTVWLGPPNRPLSALVGYATGYDRQHGFQIGFLRPEERTVMPEQQTMEDL